MSDAPRRPRGSARGRAAGLASVLGLATFAAGVPVWVRTAGSTALESSVAVEVTGTQAVPALSAAALVLLAAAAAVGLAGRVGRWVVIGVVVGAGLLLTGSSLALLTDPGPVAQAAVAEVTGVAALAAPVRMTAAPFVAAALGVVEVVAAAWLAATSRAWARPSPRHEVAATARAAAEPDDDQAAWDSLTRGNDPT